MPFSLLGGAIFLGSLWIVAGRLDSRDLKDLLSGLLGAWLPVLGWLLFIGASIIYLLAFRWWLIRAGFDFAHMTSVMTLPSVDDLLVISH